jgi:hypothetical protein
MSDEKQIEKELAGHYWEGDAEEAKRRGGGAAIAQASRRAFLKRLGLSIGAAALLIALSISGTVLVLRNSAKTGSAPLDDALSYVEQQGEYFYPSAIDHLSDDSVVYADFYCAFNADKSARVVVALHLDYATSFALKDAAGSPLLRSSESLSSFGSASLTVSFAASVEKKDGASLDFALRNLNLEPYYNFAVNQKK